MENNKAEKWKILVQACKNYYIDSLPTGLSDSEYDNLEKQALLDGFSVRDYVFQKYLSGEKTKNAYIEKIKKTKISKSMLESLKEKKQELGKQVYCDLKYDGSSLAIYLDPSRGVPKRIVTVGNLNLEDYGVDQTAKLIHFLPKRFPLGIVAIQCEALVDIDRIDNPDRARQKANGLINSKYQEAEVDQFLTLRAYRYYTDNSDQGNLIKRTDYRKVLMMFQTVRDKLDGHILFAPADVWTIEELDLNPGFTETDRTRTSTGYFLNDGWVIYDKSGVCQGALKYPGAGSGTEQITTTVRGIQWNDQTQKGKDSWSANVLIDPVMVRGCTVRKPSAGSVSKLVKKNITPGATISIILANSTIPMVGDVLKPGNGNYMWPKCSCGYQLSQKDVYGSLLKCGNPECTSRISRMTKYLGTLNNPGEVDLNKLLVIDRFKWETTSVDLSILDEYLRTGNQDDYHEYLRSFMKTDNQRKNLDLVWKASYIAYERTFYKK